MRSKSGGRVALIAFLTLRSLIGLPIHESGLVCRTMVSTSIATACCGLQDGAESQAWRHPWRAPLGYRNVMEQFEDRTIRTVAIDQEPAPFVARSCTPAVARVWHTF